MDDVQEDLVRVCNCRVHAECLHPGRRQLISGDEIRRLVLAGTTPVELAQVVTARVDRLQGTTLGVQSIASKDVRVKLTPDLRARHVYIVGKSGFGKTTLIINSIYQDLEAGNGLGVIGPEQEMFHDEILPLIPDHRLDDVIYVNPADTENPVPFNPLHLDPGEDLDLKADETLTIFKRMFNDVHAGPRMETILRQMLYTLMQIPNTTLLDAEKLLDPQNSSYRQWAVEQISDPTAEHFWLHTYPQYPRDAHLPIINRLGKFLRPKVIRNMVCANHSLNIRQAMDERKVLLFNLSDGILGDTNSQLLGQLLVAKIQLAAMSRADISKDDRTPFYLYLDEFPAFCGVADTSYEKILSRARKYGLGLVLAHQQTGQISTDLMREILGNVSTLISFFVSASDARRIAREMVTEVSGQMVELEPQQLLSLRIGQAFAKIERSVLYMKTLPPLRQGTAATRERVIERSRHSFGLGQTHRSRNTDATRIPHIDPGKVF